LIRLRFLIMLTYRVNYYSGIVIYAINIGANYFLWKAIYGDNAQLADMTITQMTTYLAVAWMARSFYFNNLDREMSNEIRDGSLAIQMVRPYNYMMVKLTQGLGEGLSRFVLFTVPGMIAAAILFPVELHADPLKWGLFLVMLFFSFLLNSMINILAGLMTFYLEHIEGLLRLKRVFVDLFSGLLVPLSFFPEAARTVLEWLPFQAITYLPASYLAGKTIGVSAWHVISIQLIWVAIMVIPLALVWRAARQRLFIQGG
jgi:ABC-2 type transport system permease protein